MLDPSDQDSSFVHADLAVEADAERRGAKGIFKVYHDRVPIDGELALAMWDIGACSPSLGISA
jgi:hypothetical protein